MQRVWLIRAGEGAVEIDSMRRGGLIAVSDTEIGETAISQPATTDPANNEPARLSQLRVRVRSFANEVKLGDLVVTPNTSRREVWLSVVTGDYRFDPEPAVGGYVHTRTADWLGWLDHDSRSMSDQLKVIDQPVPLIELYNREWWWRQLDSKQLSAAPRTTWPKPAPAKPRTTSRSTQKSAPKPTPRPKPAVMVLCAGQCGLQWSPNVLVGGLCPDCRGD